MEISTMHHASLRKVEVTDYPGDASSDPYITIRTNDFVTYVTLRLDEAEELYSALDEAIQNARELWSMREGNG